MLNKIQQIETLIDKYWKGTLSEEEVLLLEKLSQQYPSLKNLLQRLDDKEQMAKDRARQESMDIESGRKIGWERIEASITPAPVRKMAWTRFAVAAVLLLVFAGIYLLIHDKGDIGKKDLALVYDSSIKTHARQLVEKTLPDGSIVWLNANSVLQYPANFNGSSRDVELTGEGYFEIARNTAQPFLVHVHLKGKEHIIKVLGTSFNISAYKDESAFVTTLVSGKVQVTGGEYSTVLDPAEQLIVDSNDVRTRKKVNTDIATAWHKGDFNFVDKSLKEVMSEVARWYDKEIVITVPPDTNVFMSIISRQKSLESILQELSDSNSYFRFTINGDQILISK